MADQGAARRAVARVEVQHDVLLALERPTGPPPACRRRAASNDGARLSRLQHGRRAAILCQHSAFDKCRVRALSLARHTYNRSMEEALLGGLSPRVFLRRHWQKRPLLVRGALPGFRGVLDKARAVRARARDDVESRIVERRGARWDTVAHGPLRARALAARGARNSTLLVNGVNHHVRGGRATAAALRVRAAGAARRRDGELRHARRRRRPARRFLRRVPAPGRGPAALAPRPPRDSRWCRRAAQADRRIRAEQEFLLEPGDLLYLPPGWGTTASRSRPASPTRSASARRAARSSARRSSTSCTSAACRTPLPRSRPARRRGIRRGSAADMIAFARDAARRASAGIARDVARLPRANT